MNLETQKTTLPFHHQLEAELKRRQSENSRYSLRAFAKNLELDPSYLSKLLKAQRPLSPAIESHCAEKLGWVTPQTSGFSQTSMRDSYVTLDIDSFRLISEWYHYAIFELIKVKQKSWNAKTVSQALSIGIEQAFDALGRLERLGLIRRSRSHETYVRTKRGITTTGHAHSIAAFRSLQKQILTQAISAMENIPLEMRDQSSMTLAISTEKIPKAKKMLSKFRRRFCTVLQKEGNFDSVYNLSLSFYPVTQSKSEKETN